MEQIEHNFLMTVNNQEEEDFFLSHLKPEMRVLEYGSGSSTKAIAARVKEVVSIEHDLRWYNKMVAEMPANVTYVYVQPNSEPGPAYDDGTYEDFKDYVNYPLSQGRFDLIFIDGRARVACAEVCKNLGHSETLVFIHDYNHPKEQYRRTEYFKAEEYLERQEGVFTMWKFKIKNILGNKTCWEDSRSYESMLSAYKHGKENLNNTPHLKVLQNTLSKIKPGSTILDLGCGTGIASEFCRHLKYTGSDTKHILDNVTYKNYPEMVYRACDIVKQDLSWISDYDTIMLGAVIDVMEEPLKILEKVLKNAKGNVIIHRQEISKTKKTSTIINPSYDSVTFHSIINREDFNELLKQNNFAIDSESKCGFSNWEDDGSSFLLKKKRK